MVTKVFDTPHRDRTICEVEDASGECHNIPFNCEDFYLLPIEKWNNPLEFLDESTNELALLPWVIQKESDVNVYWKPVDDAANYIVSLYKTREINDRIDIYHLKDYIVDRNECFLILNGLIGGNFIFKVSAEDRNGKIIAQSRGISSSFPIYLT